jgi:hypothetical protein
VLGSERFALADLSSILQARCQPTRARRGDPHADTNLLFFLFIGRRIQLSTMVHVDKLFASALLWAFLPQCHAFSPAAKTMAVRVATPTASSARRIRFGAATIEEDVTAAAFEEEPQNKIFGEPIPYNELTIGVMKETFDGENRVSQTPDSVKMLIKDGFNVVVQAGGKTALAWYCHVCI